MAKDDLILYPKKVRGEDGYKTFSIRIKEETVEKINEISLRTGYSRNELIGRFLEYSAEHCTIAENET